MLRQAAAGVLSESFGPWYAGGNDGNGRPPGAESLATLAAGLREAGLTTPGGLPFTARILREALLKPTVAGLAAVHEHNRDTGEVTVTIVRAGWEPILDVTTWEAVKARLTDPARLTHNGNTVKHLGSQIYLCGKCGHTVRAKKGRRGAPIYTCPGCWGTGRLIAGVDAVVTAHVLARLERPDLADLLRPAPAAGVDVAALRKRREKLEAIGKAAARMFALGEIPEAEYAEAARTRKSELDKIAAALAVPAETDPLAEFRDAPDAGEVWRGLPLARRRAIVRLLVQVRLLPSKPAGRPGTIRPESVEITARV